MDSKEFIIDSSTLKNEEASYQFYLDEHLSIKSITLKSISFYNLFLLSL